MRLWGALIAAIVALVSSRALAAPAIDGTTAWLGCGGTNTLTLPALTTSNSQDAIIVAIGTGAVAGGYVVSISDTAGLTFSRRGFINDDSITSDSWEEWYAPAASPLSSDIITITFTVSRGTECYAGAAFGISGAAWPTPFDPLWGNGARGSKANTTQSFTTAGTDDLLFAHYGTFSCNSPTAGPGWTAVTSPTGSSNLLEYQVVSGAQSGTVATVGACSSSIQASLLDAFAAADGLGVLEETPKLSSYAILQTGMGTSKQNMYVIAEPGIGTSKLNAYAVTQTSTTPASGAFGKGGLILHSFPP